MDLADHKRQAADSVQEAGHNGQEADRTVRTGHMPDSQKAQHHVRQDVHQELQRLAGGRSEAMVAVADVVAAMQAATAAAPVAAPGAAPAVLPAMPAAAAPAGQRLASEPLLLLPQQALSM